MRHRLTTALPPPQRVGELVGLNHDAVPATFQGSSQARLPGLANAMWVCFEASPLGM
jgi:hypothetical protein